MRKRTDTCVFLSRGYKDAREWTRHYNEKPRFPYRKKGYSHYHELSEVEEAYNDCIQFEYLGG